MKAKTIVRIFVSLMALVMVLVCAFSFVACSKTDWDLKIAVVHKEYGQKWINALARKFEEETGLVVEVEANPNLQSEIANRLQNGSNDDIFFSHGISWELYAARGYLEPLDDLYETEVSDGVLFGDKVLPQFASASKFNGHYYKVAWTNGTGGLAAKPIIGTMWSLTGGRSLRGRTRSKPIRSLLRPRYSIPKRIPSRCRPCRHGSI